MSKLRDKLRESCYGPTQSIGFKTRAMASERQTVPLIISLSKTNLRLVPDAIEAGADALLIDIKELNQAGNALSKLSRVAGDTPWGVSLTNIQPEQIDQLVKTRCDFIVFDAAAAPASLLEEESLGKIVRIEQSLSDGLIETVRQLPVDAMLIDDQDESTPSIYHLMLCQQLAHLTNKPLLFAVSLNTNDTELQSLRKYGVDGIVTEIKAGYSKERLMKLHQDINKLPPIKENRREMGVVLPPAGSKMTHQPSEEET